MLTRPISIFFLASHASRFIVVEVCVAAAVSSRLLLHTRKAASCSQSGSCPLLLYQNSSSGLKVVALSPWCDQCFCHIFVEACIPKQRSKAAGEGKHACERMVDGAHDGLSRNGVERYPTLIQQLQK